MVIPVVLCWVEGAREAWPAETSPSAARCAWPSAHHFFYPGTANDCPGWTTIAATTGAATRDLGPSRNLASGSHLMLYSLASR